MNTASPGATYRFRKFHSKAHAGKGYRHSVDVLDEASGSVLCTCHLMGNACLTTPSVAVEGQPALQLRPDRTVMPGRWTLSSADGQAVAGFARRSLASAIVNPLGKTILTVLDSTGTETGRLVDPRSNVADRAIGSGPAEWHLVRDSNVLARLTTLPSEKPKPKTVLGRLLNVLTPSDDALVSAGPAHAMSAPAALAMLLLFKELTDSSA